MAFDFNNTPFKKKESDPLDYSYPSSSTSAPRGPQGAGPVSNPFGTGLSSGFQNVPTRGPDQSPIQKPNFVQPPQVYDPPSVKQKRPPLNMNIPWRAILPVVLAIVVLAFLYVNRYAITAFFSQLISWIVTIVVLIIIFKLLIFPGRR